MGSPTTIIVSKGTIFRDIGFFILGVSVLYFCGMDGEI